MGTETPKHIELTYDCINFINYPVKEKNEHMQTLQNIFTPLRRIVSLIGPFTEP